MGSHQRQGTLMVTFETTKKKVGQPDRKASTGTGAQASKRSQNLLRSIGNQGLQNGASFIQRLPFGISLPTGLRFLDSTEETMATGVYGSSLDFSHILLSNGVGGGGRPDRKSTRLNSSHTVISYAVFCLKKKKQKINIPLTYFKS